jgi:hypothetical protein
VGRTLGASANRIACSLKPANAVGKDDAHNVGDTDVPAEGGASRSAEQMFGGEPAAGAVRRRHERAPFDIRGSLAEAT